MTIEADKLEPYRKALRGLYSAFKNGLLYGATHPSAMESGEKLGAILTEALRGKMELSIEHTDGLFVIDGQLFIEESLFMYDLLRAVETYKIERIVFMPGVTPAEIMGFTTQLLIKPNLEPGGKPPDLKVTGNRLRVHQESGREEDPDTRRRSAAIRRVMGLYEEWSKHAETIFSKMMDEQTLPLADLSYSLEILLDALDQSPAGFSMVIALKEKANLPIEHSVQTMILSLYLGQQMGLDPSNLKSLGLAALLHDAGRLLLPSDFKTGTRLTRPDIEIVQLHARDGASLLASVPGLPTIIARVALEHHLGYDGQGYPALPAAHKPHLFSQIVGLADFVSWGTVSDAWYHRPVAFHRLIRSVLRRAGTQFDPVLVKLLLPLFGFYPPGTELLLSTGGKAVAMEPNLRNITRPSVVAQDKSGASAFAWLADLGNPPAAAFPVSVSKVLSQKWLEDAFFDLIPGEHRSKDDE